MRLAGSGRSFLGALRELIARPAERGAHVKYNDNSDIGGAVNIQFIKHMNAQEFVRVGVGLGVGGDFTAPYNTVQGSRASEFIDWHSWLDFVWSGTAWERVLNWPPLIYNDIGLAHLPLDYPFNPGP